MMYQIKTYNKIAKEGLDLFGETTFRVGEEQQDPDAVLVRSKDLHGMEINPSLKCVARAGAGVNNIPVQACSDNGVVVFNTPGANANAVKELTLCAILAASRNLFEAVDLVRTLQGSGDKVEELVEAGKSAFMGCEVLGKTLGVIGLGAIGVMVANCAIGFGMEVLGYDPYISVDSAWGLSSCVHKAESLEEVYRKSDFITLHIPLMEKTRDMVGDQAFRVMRRGRARRERGCALLTVPYGPWSRAGWRRGPRLGMASGARR
ncbi:MAG: 3-phosphoglycerate dehydrogenase [Clostridia bacterium]